jgi:hypothetical protein
MGRLCYNTFGVNQRQTGIHETIEQKATHRKKAKNWRSSGKTFAFYLSKITAKKETPAKPATVYMAVDSGAIESGSWRGDEMTEVGG